MHSNQRNFEADLPVAGTPEDLWKCLAEAEEIVKWFAPQARVKPGVGGEVWLAWNESFAGASPIEIWEPNKHLRTTHHGQDEQGNPIKIAVDYFVESVNGQTRLRIVHSGFSDKPGWEDEFHAISTGWKIFLRNLQYYLGNQHGKEVFNTWDTVPTTLSREEVWARLVGPDALLAPTNGPLALDSAFRLKGNSDYLTGTIDLDWKPFIVGGVIKNRHDALFRFTNQSAGPMVELTFLGYGDHRAKFEETKNAILSNVQAALA